MNEPNQVKEAITALAAKILSNVVNGVYDKEENLAEAIAQAAKSAAEYALETHNISADAHDELVALHRILAIDEEV